METLSSVKLTFLICTAASYTSGHFSYNFQSQELRCFVGAVVFFILLVFFSQDFGYIFVSLF